MLNRVVGLFRKPWEAMMTNYRDETNADLMSATIYAND